MSTMKFQLTKVTIRLYYKRRFLSKSTNRSASQYRDFKVFKDNQGVLYIPAYDTQFDCKYYKLGYLVKHRYYTDRYLGYELPSDYHRNGFILIKLLDAFRYSATWSEAFIPTNTGYYETKE